MAALASLTTPALAALRGCEINFARRRPCICGICATALAAAIAPATVPSTATHSAAAGLRAQLRLDAVWIEAQHRRRGDSVARVLDRIVGDGQDVGAHFDLYLHFTIHARLERTVEVGEGYEHRKQRDTLLYDGLGFDLLDCADETPVRISVNNHDSGQPAADLSDVRLVELHAHPDLGEVGHFDDGRAAADGSGG